MIDYGVTPENSGTPIPVRVGYYSTDPNVPKASHRKAGDTVILFVGGEPIKHRVTEFEAAGEEDITMYINTGTWDKVGDGVHVSEVQVVDEVGNHSQGFSPPQLIEVRRNTGPGKLLPAAYVKEAEERPDDHDRLNIDDLDGKDAHIAINVENLNYQRDDKLLVTVKGRNADGQLITKTYGPHPIASVIRPHETIWPNADVALMGNRRVQVSYQRLRPNMAPHHSASKLVDVIGPDVGTGLEPPIVEEVVGGTLPATANPVTVKINALYGYPSNAHVLLMIFGTSANGTPYYDEAENRVGVGDIYFDLPNDEPNGFFLKLNGGSAKVSYRVNGGPQSRQYEFYVGNLRAILPAPLTPQLVNPDDVFDPIKFKRLNVVVRSHPSFIEGATLTLYTEGSVPGGTAPPIPLEITEYWVGKNVPFTLSLEQIGQKQTLKIYYSLKAPGQREILSEARTIRVGTPLDLPVPEVLESTKITPTLSSLNPLHVLPPRPTTVTVRVRYAMEPNQDIQAIVEGKAGLGSPHIPIKPAIPEPGTNYVDFTLFNTFVGANLDQEKATPIVVRYVVISDHGTETSKPLTLLIEPLPAEDWDLVRVPQAEANGGVMDTTKAHDVQVDAWHFSRNARVSKWVIARSTVDLVLRNGTPLTPEEFAAKRTVTPIPAAYLRKLDNDAPIVIEAFVSLDGTGSLATAVPFTPVRYKIKKQPGVVDSINVGGGPDRILINAEGTVAYVANYTTNTVSVIDLTTFRLSDTIVMPASHATTGLALHPDGSRLYVTGYYSNQIHVIDTSDNTICNKVTDVYINSVGALTFNLDGSRLYHGTYAHGKFQVIDTSNDTLISTHSSYYPTEFALAPEGTRLYCTGYNLTGVIDTASNTQVSTISGFYNAQRLAYSPHGPRLYIPDPGYANLKIVDTRTNLISNTVQNLKGAFGIAFHPTRPLAYVTMTSDNSMAIINTDKEEVITIMKGFVQPKGIAIAPDGSYALVSNYTANTVFIIQL